MEQAGVTDEALMERYVLQGDRLAFEELFRRYSGRLYGFFMRMTGNVQLSKDMVQQTFLHVHRARNDFQLDRAFRPWVYTIASNVRREHFRWRSRRPETPYNETYHGEPATSPDVSSVRDRLVQRALQELGEDQRQVLVLHWYEGLSFREIGELVGASTSAVKVRAHRAYKKLRLSLQDD